MHIGEHTPATYAISQHIHKDLEVGLCLEGKGWFYFGQKTYEVRPGDIFVVNAGVEPHIAQSDRVHPSKYLFLSFESSELGPNRQNLLLPFVYRPARFQNRLPAEHPSAGYAGTLMRLIMEEYRYKKEAHEAMLQGLLLQLCTVLLRYYGQNAQHGEWYRALRRYDDLQPGLAFIRENFREPIAAEDVAACMSLSVSRTLHLFSETLGIGVKQVILQHRLHEAMRLLAETDRPATEIALACGFQSLASFYRNFTRSTGVSPQEFREQTAHMTVLEKHPASLEKLDL